MQKNPQPGERWCSVGVSQTYDATTRSLTPNYDLAHALEDGEAYSPGYITTDEHGVTWGVCPRCAAEFARYGTD